MNMLLSDCQQWLIDHYASVSIGFNQDSGPRWRVVSRDSLTDSATAGQRAAGVVEDGEIGLLLYLLPLAENATPVTEQVAADINLALKLRSQLLPRYSGSESPNNASDDVLGTWRICLHWLVPTNSEAKWRDAIMLARQQSGAFDEVAVDAIFFENGEGVRTALDRHGLPRLLLVTRQVFALGASDVENWKSADEDVRGALAGFADGFSRSTEKAIAGEIERKADAYAAGRISPTERTPTELKSLEIENFRSIGRLKLDGSPGRDGVHKARTWIVFGPNGTGKTSLAEAISIATEGSSTKFRDFLNDKDIVKEKSAQGYVQNYLSPKNGSEHGAEPRIAIDIRGMLPISQRLVRNFDEASAAKARLEGAIGDQEESREFAQLSSNQLACRVASSFSTLARELADHLDNGYETAHAKRSAFNRDFGLTAIAKKRDTIFARIGERKLAEALARPAAGLLDYLRVRSKLGGDEGRTAETVLAEWEDIDIALRSQGEMLARLAALISTNEENMADAVRPFVTSFATRVVQTRILLLSLKEQTVDLAGELPEMLQSARSWAEWLARPAATASSESGASAEPLNRRLAEMLVARNKIEAQGQAARKRLEHLISALQYVTLWEKDHPDTCPTCASQVSDRGGIRKVAEELHDEVEAKLGEIRAEYQTCSQEIRAIEAQLKALGQDQCPVPEATRDRLNDILSRVVGQPFDASAWLGVPERRGVVERLLAHMATPPAEPAEIGLDGQAKILMDVSATIATKWREAEQIGEEPDAWESVRKAFQDLTQSIIAAHLPNTLERVWWEIAASLTSAPWLLPARPSFQLEIRRGDQRVYLTAGKNTLVHYLLNNAEQHVLGLAWTFTRFMVDSRFRHAWLVLDDPAQEMDQPTFRELTRFLATLLRLHEYAARPFTLLLLLHQEERALDAARETDSGLYMLGWTDRQTEFTDESNTVRRMRINGPGFHSPQARMLFEPSATENHAVQ
ncbi:MAG: hypothetical protein A3H93_18390 [Rhodocyclales bacterium RIFCSPLOWO2_02_FULL_63_24]|nr:MAG: hypothetical protein A3H93_18390 [Rhodocyclales bacterium RIFCSPLOWO2_02_FULL_63_24]